MGPAVRERSRGMVGGRGDNCLRTRRLDSGQNGDGGGRAIAGKGAGTGLDSRLR